jgi:Domain of unknown function (DUF5664)
MFTVMAKHALGTEDKWVERDATRMSHRTSNRGRAEDWIRALRGDEYTAGWAYDIGVVVDGKAVRESDNLKAPTSNKVTPAIVYTLLFRSSSYREWMEDQKGGVTNHFRTPSLEDAKKAVAASRVSLPSMEFAVGVVDGKKLSVLASTPAKPEPAKTIYTQMYQSEYGQQHGSPPVENSPRYRTTDRAQVVADIRIAKLKREFGCDRLSIGIVENRVARPETMEEAASYGMATPPGDAPKTNIAVRLDSAAYGDQKIKTAAGKAPLSLIPLATLQGPARVKGYGAKKYKAGNYYEANLSDGAGARYVGGALRHLAEMQLPNGLHTPESLASLDSESGLPHIDHAICGLLMLRTIMIKNNALPADPGEGNEPPTKETR